MLETQFQSSHSVLQRENFVPQGAVKCCHLHIMHSAHPAGGTPAAGDTRTAAVGMSCLHWAAFPLLFCECHFMGFIIIIQKKNNNNKTKSSEPDLDKRFFIFQTFLPWGVYQLATDSDKVSVSAWSWQMKFPSSWHLCACKSESPSPAQQNFILLLESIEDPALSGNLWFRRTKLQRGSQDMLTGRGTQALAHLESSGASSTVMELQEQSLKNISTFREQKLKIKNTGRLCKIPYPAQICAIIVLKDFSTVHSIFKSIFHKGYKQGRKCFDIYHSSVKVTFSFNSLFRNYPGVFN